MTEEQPTLPVEKDALVARVQGLFAEGHRLVQIGATPLGESLEINYSFDKDGRFLNLRLTVPMEQAEVPSISGIYWSAFLYENEMHDLFGLTVHDMAIDFKGNLYKTTVAFPFRPAATPKGDATP